MTQIRVYVKSKSMHGHTLLYSQTECSNFFIPDPDSGILVLSGVRFNFILPPQQVNKRCLHGVYKPANTLLILMKLDNRISDDLPWSMISYIASAVDLMDRYSLRCKLFTGQVYVGRVSPCSQC